MISKDTEQTKKTSEVKKAEKEHLNASRRTRKETVKLEKYRSLETKPVGRPPDFEKRAKKAAEEECKAADDLKRARENQEAVRKNKLKFGRVYHPYDTETGRKQSPKTVEALLDDCFEKIDEATESLSERCRKHVEKARRVAGKMKATIAFFFSMVGTVVENMEVSSDIKRIVYDLLVPGSYLLEAGRKEKDVELAEKILERAQELLSVFHDRCGVLAHCSEEELESIEGTSKECAWFFQRSSSPVEWRNAQLSLRHHNMHRLSNLKMSALTAIHNFYIKRPDGTTATERFFGSKPKIMFEHLLDRIDFPARPRRKRLKLSI
ncbi:MAG: universal stress protein [Proteobacteria bacterium]|nr:universal stress protein [Pseudomonadota bacterium]